MQEDQAPSLTLTMAPHRQQLQRVQTLQMNSLIYSLLLNLYNNSNSHNSNLVLACLR